MSAVRHRPLALPPSIFASGNAMSELLATILTDKLAIAYSIVILAGIARGFTGFAAGLVNVGLLTLLFGPLEAIRLSSVFALISSVMILQKTLHTVNWKEAGPLSLATGAMTPLGATLLLVTHPGHVKPVIGAFVVGCGLLLVYGWRYRGPRNIYVSTIIGAITGAVTGFTGAGGPLTVFYFLAAPEPVVTKRANISLAVFAFAIVITITLYLNGAFGVESMVRAALLFPGTVLGTWIGMRLFEIVPSNIYGIIANWTLVVIGLSVLLS